MTASRPEPRVQQQQDFERHAAAGHTRIPVVREVLSDLDTPLSVYLKLADGPHTYLFESVEGGERFGRYSIIGLPAKRVYAFAGNTLLLQVRVSRWQGGGASGTNIGIVPRLDETWLVGIKTRKGG